MKRHTRTNRTVGLLAVASLAVSGQALADPIEIIPLGGDGALPTTLGDYDMEAFPIAPVGDHTCTDSHSGAEVCFEDMAGDPMSIPAEAPDWWQYPAHGNVFVLTAPTTWVRLIMPENTRAFSLFVGANMGATAWIQAFNGDDFGTDQVFFNVGPDNTLGYGVHATNCSPITHVDVDPILFQWGVGGFASNEGKCASVPEPAPITLLGLGLLGLALTRRLKRVRTGL